MPVQFSCSCGQLLRVADRYVGQRVRCPSCQQTLQVKPAPGRAANGSPTPVEVQRTAARSSPRTISAPTARVATVPGAVATRPPSTPASRTVPRNSSAFRGRFLWWGGTGAVLAILLCVTGMLAAWALRGSKATELAGHFTPAQGGAAAGVSVSTKRMHDVAASFVQAARLRESVTALQLVDRDLFGKRLLSDEGSHEALGWELSPKEVLGHLTRYPLDGMSSARGRRLWDVVGTSRFDGLPAQMVRYYVEPDSPAGLVRDPELLEPLTELVTLEEFQAAAPSLFRHQRLYKTMYGNNDSLETNYALAPRFGYALLLFDHAADGALALCDVVDLMAMRPMSRTAGKRFMDDHHILGYDPGSAAQKAQRRAARRVVHSLFGDVAEGVPLLHPQLSLESTFSNSVSWEDVEETLEEHPRSRPVWITTVVTAMYLQPDRAAPLVQRFRDQFPDDPGADLAVLFVALLPDEPRTFGARASAVADSARRLHAMWRDPFLLSIQAIAAEAQGDEAAARKLCRQALDQGHQSTSVYRTLLLDAVERGDKHQAVELLRRFNAFWTQVPTQENDREAQRFASRWQRMVETRQRPEAESGAEGRSRGIPFLGRRGVPLARSGHRPSSNRYAGAARGGPAASSQRPTARPQPRPAERFSRQRPGRRPGPQSPQPPLQIEGPSVRFNLTNAGGLDLGALTQSLRHRGITHVRAHVSNGEGYLSIQFDGTIAEARALVNFGEVVAVDEAKRTLQVDCRSQD